jgi:hypothetical protein
MHSARSDMLHSMARRHAAPQPQSDTKPLCPPCLASAPGGATMTALRIKGGGDEARPAVTRHEPWSQTPDAAALQTQPLTELVSMALRLYDDGRHDTPNVFTKNGNVRDRYSSNGSTGRVRKFLERELDPQRVRARSAAVARAQDVLAVAEQVHSQQAVVAELLQQLISAGPPDEDDGDDQASFFM